MSVSDEDILKQLPKRRKVGSNVYIQGLCDVCELPDGKCGFNMQKCIDCGVCVHDRCYCIVYTNEDDHDNMKKLKIGSVIHVLV